MNIIGDFDINLHKTDGDAVKKFEDFILNSDPFHLISAPSHAKPGSEKSFMDNNFTGNISSMISSGTIELGISHHYSIFQFSEINHEQDMKVFVTQYYAFSNSKTE